ncbi:WAT1-related protein At4g15540-like [Durio zibethinus]|uniref:WAT1-related protein At4g15540-like n=1 Tax=Durio zibethinus TaxID=66656 RepID=A0A6P6BEK3_DURZI|nr:WAT1-related protein At4g15540-like [Durio zibethinus]
MSSWRLRPSIVAASVLHSVRNSYQLQFCCAQVWGVRLKGPGYVAIFRPLSIVIAAVMSAIFLGDELYLGSAIGALILSAEIYAVLRGIAREEERTDDDDSGLLSGSKVP